MSSLIPLLPPMWLRERAAAPESVADADTRTILEAIEAIYASDRNGAKSMQFADRILAARSGGVFPPVDEERLTFHLEIGLAAAQLDSAKNHNGTPEATHAAMALLSYEDDALTRASASLIVDLAYYVERTRIDIDAVIDGLRPTS